MDFDRRLLLKAMSLTAGGILLPRAAEAAIPSKVRDIRMWTAPDHTRFVFDLDRPAKHSLFRLKSPSRVVLDIDNAVLAGGASKRAFSDPVVRRFRTGSPRRGATRAVFELARDIRPRSFMLKGNGKKGPRLVVDLFHKEASRSVSSGSRGRHKRRNAVIVIDPGHGGEDPGAIGRHGTEEKTIALSVGRKLYQRINDTPGYEAHLTRKGDYYVSLRRRVAIARRHSPDLFISLHADAFKQQSARGASVYCLSERGKPTPDHAIKALVRRENNADLIGGVNLHEVMDPEVAGILMDLSQRDSINRALVLGKQLLRSLKRTPRFKLHFKQVKQAGFAVLKAPDMPSVLVEMAFLTNPKEERQLRRDSHQNQLADALFRGTRRFLDTSHRA
ncbi:MAG: N-acetylmuramoyl-L-alanine amidase [Magnetococcales bacterium]|nr:N-acetylmuramoyl-L-alanine amidase [Magnetococcales bacterium]